MKTHYIWAPALALLIAACSSKENSAASDPNDFDVFCKHFTQLTASEDFAQLTNEERAERLETQLAKILAPSENAYVAWTAIRNGPPLERYMWYKEAAASTGLTNWTCAAAEQHGHEVGITHD